jgi:hypothetical protein
MVIGSPAAMAATARISEQSVRDDDDNKDEDDENADLPAAAAAADGANLMQLGRHE